jgi:hypothetical protein
MEKADYNREWLKNLGDPKEIRCPAKVVRNRSDPSSIPLVIRIAIGEPVLLR